MYMGDISRPLCLTRVVKLGLLPFWFVSRIGRGKILLVKLCGSCGHRCPHGFHELDVNPISHMYTMQVRQSSREPSQVSADVSAPDRGHGGGDSISSSSSSRPGRCRRRGGGYSERRLQKSADYV